LVGGDMGFELFDSGGIGGIVEDGSLTCDEADEVDD